MKTNILGFSRRRSSHQKACGKNVAGDLLENTNYADNTCSIRNQDQGVGAVKAEILFYGNYQSGNALYDTAQPIASRVIAKSSQFPRFAIDAARPDQFMQAHDQAKHVYKYFTEGKQTGFFAQPVLGFQSNNLTYLGHVITKATYVDSGEYSNGFHQGLSLFIRAEDWLSHAAEIIVSAYEQLNLPRLFKFGNCNLKPLELPILPLDLETSCQDQDLDGLATALIGLQTRRVDKEKFSEPMIFVQSVAKAMHNIQEDLKQLISFSAGLDIDDGGFGLAWKTENCRYTDTVCHSEQPQNSFKKLHKKTHKLDQNRGFIKSITRRSNYLAYLDWMRSHNVKTLPCIPPAEQTITEVCRLVGAPKNHLIKDIINLDQEGLELLAESIRYDENPDLSALVSILLNKTINGRLPFDLICAAFEILMANNGSQGRAVLIRRAIMSSINSLNICSPRQLKVLEKHRHLCHHLKRLTPNSDNGLSKSLRNGLTLLRAEQSFGVSFEQLEFNLVMRKMICISEEDHIKQQLLDIENTISTIFSLSPYDQNAFYHYLPNLLKYCASENCWEHHDYVMSKLNQRLEQNRFEDLTKRSQLIDLLNVITLSNTPRESAHILSFSARELN